MIKKRFRDRVVLITGASRGIGRATAFELAREGATLVLTGLASDRAMLDDSAERCRPLGEVLVRELDVRDAEGAREVVRAALGAFGRIDILLNNAGIATVGAFQDADIRDVQRMIEVNVGGTLNMAHAVLPSMLERRSGRIVNIASIMGRRGVPMFAAYGATKAAIVNFSETLRAELHGTGVSVASVLPMAVNTGFTQSVMHRMKSKAKLPGPEEVARAIVHVAAGDQTEVTPDLAGKALVLMNRLAPSLLDLAFARVRPLKP